MIKKDITKVIVRGTTGEVDIKLTNMVEIANRTLNNVLVSFKPLL
jgi:hypothetical protein